MPRTKSNTNTKSRSVTFTCARKLATYETRVARADDDEEETDADDEYWRDDNKLLTRKIQRKENMERKRQEHLQKKAETKALLEREMSLLSISKSSFAKMSKAQLIAEATKRNAAAWAASTSTSNCNSNGNNSIPNHHRTDNQRLGQPLTRSKSEKISLRRTDDYFKRDDTLKLNGICVQREDSSSIHQKDLLLLQQQQQREQAKEENEQQQQQQEEEEEEDHEEEVSFNDRFDCVPSTKNDKYADKRLKVQYNKYERKRLPILKIEKPYLKLSQLKHLLYKEWIKSAGYSINHE